MLKSLIKENISLKDKCYYKTGGNALYFAEPKSINELIFCLDFAKSKNIKFEIIGYGANLLISDKGFNGIIISMANFNHNISLEKNNIFCGAGIKLSDFVDFAVDNSLKGAENLAGIPGSIGGAIIMNAGAFGTEIKMYSLLGADVVGMTMFPEVALSREAEICYTSFNIITNMAAGIEENKKLTMDEVAEIGSNSSKTVCEIIKSLSKIMVAERNCICKNALNGAAAC